MILKRRRNRLRVVSAIVGAVAIGIFAAGVVVGLRQHRSNQAATQQTVQAVEAANNGQPSNAPSTTPPDEREFNAYRAGPGEPRYLFIPKLSVRAMVKPMGRDDKNRMQTPKNIHHAGWFTESAKPGLPGAVIIDGHVSNWSGGKSIFHDLHQLTPGDEIIIERGDGKRFTYHVAKSQSYPADNVDMGAVLGPVNPEKPGLNLITCDGKVVKGNEYDKRLVVFAQQQ